ncbi:MAG TPA: DOMON-like domain-containing protein [Povalibacter sp.]|nr:DOMON-like domain-containing protein [Povalibacter sp.]
MASFILQPHRATPCDFVDSVTVEVAPAPGAWQFTYRVAGDIDRLDTPAPVRSGPPERTHELWRYTCFEAFARRPSDEAAGDETYAEFNFSPSGAWAAYRFDRYRAGMADLELAQPPGIVCQRQSHLLTVEVRIAAPELLPGSPLALSAVLKDLQGRVCYWALAHPAGKPDFHAAVGFTAILE